VHTFVIPEEGIFEDLYDLLEEYPNEKIVLTNANDEQMENFGLHDLPYEVFTLKHDPDKPDPAYFKTMLDNFNLSADEVVYFEHDQEAVKSAESVGITTCYYDPESQDLEALKKFLDKNL